MIPFAASFHSPLHNWTGGVISTHGINSDTGTLRQRRLAPTLVAFFLLLCDGDDKLAFVEAAARAHAVRDMKRSTLRALGEPRQREALPIGASGVAPRGGMMFFWISHESNLPIVVLVHINLFRLKEKLDFALGGRLGIRSVYHIVAVIGPEFPTDRAWRCLG